MKSFLLVVIFVAFGYCKNGFDTNCLKAHNLYRKRHRAKAMTWSESLAADAQKWADQLAKDDAFEHDYDTIKAKNQGENLAYFSPPKAKCIGEKKEDCVQCAEMIKDWYDEVKDYDFTTGKAKQTGGVILHFTQVVWDSSLELGVGTAVSKSYGFITVARYSPRGNKGRADAFRENVFPENNGPTSAASTPGPSVKPVTVKPGSTSAASTPGPSVKPATVKPGSTSAASTSRPSVKPATVKPESQGGKNNSGSGDCEYFIVSTITQQHKIIQKCKGKPNITFVPMPVPAKPQQTTPPTTATTATTTQPPASSQAIATSSAPTSGTPSTHSTTDPSSQAATSSQPTTARTTVTTAAATTAATAAATTAATTAATAVATTAASAAATTVTTAAATTAASAAATTVTTAAGTTAAEATSTKSRATTQSSQGPSSQATTFPTKQITANNIKDKDTQAVMLSNLYRAIHEAHPMLYSQDIANGAQKWAEQLAKDDQLSHDSNTQDGENLASVPKSDKSVFDAFDAWYEESAKYDFKKPGFSKETGHFTQLVWKNSKSVGVGIATNGNGDKVYVVARFRPAGNIAGRFQANVGPNIMK